MSRLPAPIIGVGDSVDPATSFLGLSLQRGDEHRQQPGNQKPASGAKGHGSDSGSAAGESDAPHLPGTSEPLPWYTRNCRGKFAADWALEPFPGFLSAMKWKATGKPPKFPTPEEAAKLCPSVDKVDHDRLRTPPCGPTRVQATWMGHASFLVQVGGVNILTDPVWSTRCAPVQFAGPKRYVPPPVEKVSDLPTIDIVTISHNHYDHLDAATVAALREAFQPTFVVPLGMKAWFAGLKWKPTSEERAAGVDDPTAAKVIELDWWEARWIRPACHESHHLAPVLITLVPVQHWSMRTGPWDRDMELWGGFVYEVDVSDHHHHAGGSDHEPVPRRIVRRLFHCGDTGYSDVVFKKIGQVFRRRFDLAMIPIGAYEPRWMMHVQHVDPEEAVKIHVDLGRPALSLGMHWGTFILTDEPVDEPPKLLKEALAKHKALPTEFIALKHGESVVAPVPGEIQTLDSEPSSPENIAS
uniref:Metallo-beta-lactamase domain-containing protein n=1 Tax=Neobodo designis TaxID=312471 RepID=A0A7S1QDM4_NEODS|mmetsp:Transcript_39439/g.121980  ORF Transcript_39439/g.121980 Transcript_39439/m.121980 type:complete len:469 (+) Transcript_39439:61-1467(+)|eukprot:CAMPEP_0174840932 /NCGR_PEP_ID=MMETSP1114-20130205/8988_1 /TAXON_ID=312471 /ORGANISM="Neobodo designis, Strain CCAP 1951/1" /LENGTH=468 /DNA_ID=CAMNT_0016075101 /DNA_START=61 /DNA_END=1467 /DNA_ORIENTATION=+